MHPAIDHKLSAVLIGALVYFLAFSLFLPNAWAIFRGGQVPMSLLPILAMAWGVGGWIAGRPMNRKGVLGGFFAGVLGTLLLIALTQPSTGGNLAAPLAIIFAVGVLFSSVGGWLGGIASRDSG